MKILHIILLILISSCSKSQFFYHLIGHGIPLNYFYPPNSGDITFSDTDFQYSIPGYAGTNFTARSTAGYVQLQTTETRISVKIGGNWSTISSPFNTQSECEVLVDGVYNQSITLTDNDVTQTYDIILPAGQKMVTLMNGYTANPSPGDITIPRMGVYIQGVITDTIFRVVRPVTPQRKWLFVGNSITTGANADHPALTGFVGLFRNDGRSIQSDAFGSRRLLTVSSSDAHNMAAFISDEMNGTLSNELFMLLGTNNFTVSGGQSKATFKSEYQNFLDSLHSLRPDIIVYCISPMDRTTYSTPNSQGATLEDYSDAIQELLITRTWAKFIYGKNLLTLANTTDGLHPNQTGMQEIHDKLLIAYNALQ